MEARNSRLINGKNEYFDAEVFEAVVEALMRMKHADDAIPILEKYASLDDARYERDLIEVGRIAKAHLDTRALGEVGSFRFSFRIIQNPASSST